MNAGDHVRVSAVGDLPELSANARPRMMKRYSCWITGWTEWGLEIEAETPSRARYAYWLKVHEHMKRIPYTAVRSRRRA